MTGRDKLRTQIAIGWVTLLFLLLIMLLFGVILSAFDNDQFSALRSDFGRGVLRVMTYVVGAYALMPLLTFILDASRFQALRWLMVAFASINFLFMLMHHMSHWHAGQRPTFNSHFLDLTYHAIGLYVLYCSIQWAKRDNQSVPNAARAPAEARNLSP